MIRGRSANPVHKTITLDSAQIEMETSRNPDMSRMDVSGRNLFPERDHPSLSFDGSNRAF